MIKIIESAAFLVSVTAFGYGAYRLFRREIPKFFKLYVCATGCYMLEELWVIVNSLLGNGGQDGLLTVRVFGFFGCLCFMLSANAGGFDKAVDEKKNKKAKLFALIAPVGLLALYSLYAFSPANDRTALVVAIELISISPALPAAYLSLKHLLLPEDEMGFLRLTRGINITALIFYAVNYAYPFADLYCPRTVMSIYDLTLGFMIFAIVLLCGMGADKWKTLI